jgi:hypothetical protein
MWRAFQLGRLFVVGLVLLIGLLLMAYSAVNNALNYTEVEGTVQRVELLCRLRGAPDERAAPCTHFLGQPETKKLLRNTVVYLRYRSPADGREYDHFVHVVGGQKAVEAARLRSGDRLLILAHNKEPLRVKRD